MEEEEEKWPFYEDYSIKIGLIGDYNVGKTSLIKNFIKLDYVRPTIGLDYFPISLNTNKGLIKLNIIDPSGNERFKEITKNSFRGCEGIIFIYDLSSKKSFNFIKERLQFITNNNFKNCNYEFILIENKIDLKSEVTNNEKYELIEKYHLDFFQYGNFKGIDKNGEPILRLIGKIFKNKNIVPNRNILLKNTDNDRYLYYRSSEFDIIINKDSCI